MTRALAVDEAKHNVRVNWYVIFHNDTEYNTEE